MSKREQRSSGKRLSIIAMLFFFLAFLLPALRNGDQMGYLLMIAVPCMIWTGAWLLPRLLRTDWLLMTLTLFLSALGILLLYDIQPAWALQQVIACGIGLAAMVFCICLVRVPFPRQRVFWGLLFVSLILLALPLLWGQEVNGIKNRISLGTVSLQPGELVKLSLVPVLAFFLSRRRFLPWILFSVVCAGAFLLQRDPASALICFICTLLLFWASTGNLPLTLVGIAGGAGAVWYGIQHPDALSLRVETLQRSWIQPNSTGEQVTQSIAALSGGGLWGTGLGMSAAAPAAVSETDLLPLLCDRFGLFFAFCVLLIYAAMIWRGTEIAMSARRSFHGLLAMGATLMIGLQALMALINALGLIPLTGTSLPFLSSNPFSLVSGFCLAGFLQGVESLNRSDLEEDARLTMMERG